MSGEFRLGAAPSKVWDALNDPDVLKQCIPGCESIEKISNTELKAIVKAKIGPVSASFKGQVTLSDLDPPNGYRISGEGSGGAAGFAKGGAQVRLEPDGSGTILRYEVDATVGGKLAQIGQRLIDGTAKKLSDEFFANFAAAVDRPDSSETTSGSPAEALAKAGGVRSIYWFGGLALIVAVLLFYFLSR